MPELPDLQVFSQNLTKKFAGKRLQKLNIVNKKKLKQPAARIRKALEKQKLTKVYREGKELRFAFANDNLLGLHLMLHGNLKLFQKKNKEKHTIAELLFDNDNGLAITDWQGMANIRLNPEEKDVPDALSKKMNEKYLKEQLKSKAGIKNILVDQNIIRGIGNAYADEILWEAGISPFSIANKIPVDKIKLLTKTIKSVLTKAEKQIKKIHPDLISGEVRDFLRIHNSKKKTSPTGAAIHSRMVASRKTYYTDEQEIYE